VFKTSFAHVLTKHWREKLPTAQSEAMQDFHVSNLKITIATDCGVTFNINLCKNISCQQLHF
jgi:hypothetical protein